MNRRSCTTNFFFSYICVFCLFESRAGNRRQRLFEMEEEIEAIEMKLQELRNPTVGTSRSEQNTRNDSRLKKWWGAREWEIDQLECRITSMLSRTSAGTACEQKLRRLATTLKTLREDKDRMGHLYDFVDRSLWVLEKQQDLNDGKMDNDQTLPACLKNRIQSFLMLERALIDATKVVREATRQFVDKVCRHSSAGLRYVEGHAYLICDRCEWTNEVQLFERSGTHW